MGYIYKISNLVNGKCYIGESKQKDIKKRWNKHIISLKTKKGSPALIGAFEKYGIENFKFEILIICFNNDRFFYEIEYIQKFNALVPNGYNILEGRIKIIGINSKSFQEFIEKKKEVSSIYKDKTKLFSDNKNYDKLQKVVEEGQDGNDNSRKHTDETKSKISQSIKNYFDNDKNLGNIEKHREIMTKCKGKIINQYSLENEFLNQFKSIREAERETSISRSNIQFCLYGQTKQAGGYIWKYV
jgi:group I intron endonuclease